MKPSLILDTDSYKSSHWLQYPPNTTGMYSYFESRGGRYGSTVFFGLQHLLLEYLQGAAFTQVDVDEAARFMAKHGEPFNREGWQALLDRHGGRLPIVIKAVPEGTVVPTHSVLLTVESTDPEFFWLVSWLETKLVRLWYPITVATQSFHIKRTIFDYLNETSDDPAGEIGFKLHDFGARGVSSMESAGIGGMAHLVNFLGSDTIEGVRYANHYYSADMAAFSIPASEHSTITMWGREREFDAYRNMVRQFAKPGALFACVSDSYDLWNAIENAWGDQLRDELENSGATLVVRPDSGHPASVVLKTLQTLERKVGAPKNLRGYKQLPKWLRVIQGDGIDQDSIAEILATLKAHGYSASNIAFGMGGALLQKVDRDTQKFAFKCSEATVDGKRVRVFKDPITDGDKRSKAGRLSLVQRDGKLITVEGEQADDLLKPVFENGEILQRFTFEQVRKNAARGLL
ncbi:MAG TPA: nicotinate phosphoribosyltransferase [Polyangiaceae bacterium]|nr:nicotinate phosphoribosyltransferase [Polyangiaceae bacterium]